MSLGKKQKAAHAAYAFVVFLSAFLLFLAEPMIGKRLLPYFGGSSSVWAVSLLFFTTTLFLGYLYVFFLTKMSVRVQVIFHSALALVSGALLLILVRSWHALFPPLAEVHGAMRGTGPEYVLLGVLVSAVGLPLFLLSTTSPLLQYWWARVSGREPYRLYALSNFGSFIGLALFPFVIEPTLPLRSAEGLWIAAFLAYALLAILIAFFSLSHIRHDDETAKSPSPEAAPSWLSLLGVMLLAALPAFLLVAVSTHITQAIAPMPLLWTIPLALYLATLVLAFAGWGVSRFVALVTFLSALWAYHHFWSGPDAIPLQILSALALLFFGGLLAHARLYALRPATPHLPLFYAVFAFGGALGTLLAGFAAPLIFTGFTEYPLGIALVAVIALLFLDLAFFPRILSERHVLLARAVLLVVALALFIDAALGNNDVPTVAVRDFYGVTRVTFPPGAVMLMHGGTLHGYQAADPEWRFVPTSYYAPSSGVGRALRFARAEAKERPLRIGIVGLGSGTLASYCAPGDTFVFYEINETMVRVAREYFSYLAHCPGADVRIGDARLTLEEEQTARSDGYDMLAIDAFSDDTIPAHLLTREAILLYLSRLSDEHGILALHISNRYLDLAPVILQAALDLRLSYLSVLDSPADNPLAGPSHWVLLSRKEAAFSSSAFSGVASGLETTEGPLWTDDFASLLPLIHFGK